MEAATIPARAVSPPAGRGAPTIVGVVLTTLAALLVLAGGALVALHLAGRDADGYYSSSTARLAAPGYALVSEEVDLTDLDNDAARTVAQEVTGRVRVAAHSDGGKPVFVGIAPKQAVDAYLSGVAHSTVTEVYGNHGVSYATRRGGAPLAAPGARHFWRVSSAGAGRQSATWKITDGRWAVVVMNADGSRGVHARVQVAAKTSFILWAGLGILAFGLVVGAGGVALLNGRRPAQTAAPEANS